MLYGRHVREAGYDRNASEWLVRSNNRADGAVEDHRFDALVLSDKLLLLPNPYAILKRDEWGALSLPPSLASTGTVVLMLALRGERTTGRVPPILRDLPPPLSLAVCDSLKPQRRAAAEAAALELWVVHSTPEYAAAHLSGDDPPDLDDADAVQREMQDVALRAIDAARAEAAPECANADPLTVVHSSVFAWDHAQTTPGSRLASTHQLDAARRVGLCGDYFAGADQAREGVEAAALSGSALARAMVDAFL